MTTTLDEITIDELDEFIKDNKDEEVVPFRLRKGLYEKQGELYVPTGKVTLPMSAERFDDYAPERTPIVFTAFRSEYFNGLKTLDYHSDGNSLHDNHFDWAVKQGEAGEDLNYSTGLHDDILVTQGPFSKRNVERHAKSLLAIRDCVLSGSMENPFSDGNGRLLESCVELYTNG